MKMILMDVFNLIVYYILNENLILVANHVIVFTYCNLLYRLYFVCILKLSLYLISDEVFNSNVNSKLPFCGCFYLHQFTV